MTNEQNAKRLEELSRLVKLQADLVAADTDTTLAYENAALLRESAAMWREREEAEARIISRWSEWFAGRTEADYGGYELRIEQGSQAITHKVIRGRRMLDYGIHPTLDAAKAAAIQWVDGQEGK